MLDHLILNKKSIESIYKTICEFHEKYLKQFGVKLPKLYDSQGNFTKDALVLVYLAYDYPNTRKVSKEELTKFVRSYYPNTNDVQQARHLGAQAGWWIVAGGRDNIVLRIERGSYQLYTLEQPYPGFKKGHRISDTDDWDKIKKNAIIVAPFAARRKVTLIFIGRPQKQFCKKRIWTQINLWLPEI